MTFHGISALVFDFDGTLATCPYDFAHMRQVILATAEEFDIPAAELGGHGLLEMIAAGAAWLRDEPARAQAFHAIALARLGALEYEAAGATRLLPGVVAALQSLRAAGYRLGIVTRNSLPAVARIIGAAPLPYGALLCREDVAHPKPHPAHVRQMLRLLERAPAQALMVGDHPMDIAMGQAVGMPTVAVLTGQSTPEELRAAAPDLLLPAVTELATLLLESPPCPSTPATC